ncbi:MAG: HDOD domain-containing protein [Azoarcus sp.]|jgi:HD-like signal output (HDOD) protein|nr:HDOD domain-containing protein [Azoarcus sp.]
MAVLTQALASAESYVNFFSHQPIPVLRRTSVEIKRMAEDMDNASRQEIAALILADPLMSMRMLSHIETHRKNTQNHDIVTISSALVMMGILPFFRAFGDLPTAEDALNDRPQALVGLLRVVGRACKASRFARDWAVVRHDLDVNEITIAALLHEAAEMMCWINAPDLTQQVADMQRTDRGLRSSIAQREVFGVTAREIQFGLIRAWRLPDLLIKLLDESKANDPRVQTIILATNFARHLAHGWENAALPDDIYKLHDLLRIPYEALLRRVDAPQEFWPYLLSVHTGTYRRPEPKS